MLQRLFARARGSPEKRKTKEKPAAGALLRSRSVKARGDLTQRSAICGTIVESERDHVPRYGSCRRDDC
jgi:hypothetical protein